MKFFIFILTISLGRVAFCDSYGFVAYSEKYKPDEKSKITIPKEPPYRSQDTVGVCYAMTAAAAYDVAYCKDQNLDCKNLPSDQSCSSIEMSSFSSTEQVANDGIKKPTVKREKIQISEGGSAYEALYNALYEKDAVTKESCAPFDKIVARQGSPQEVQDLQMKAWENLRRTYEQYRRTAEKCSECALNEITSTAVDNIKQDFGVKKSNEEILKAFGAETYSKFLGELLIPAECSDPKQKIAVDGLLWDFKVGEKKDFSDYKKSIAKLKDVLKTGNPMIIDGYCTKDEMPKKYADCANQQHSFLITGYRKVCNSKNECHDTVKVHNSWGQSWQDKTGNGGWVDAKEVLDRTYYRPEVFSWLQEK